MNDNDDADKVTVGTTDEAQLTEEEVSQLVEAKIGQLIEVRSDSENPGLEDVWIAGQPLGKIIESNRETAKSAEKLAREARSSEDEPTGKSDEDGSNRHELLPIQRIARLKQSDDQDESPFADTTPSVDRAVAIFQHFGEWSKKAPSGRVIKSNLKNLLTTATGESLAWKQIYRACRKLEEWSKGAIQFIQHDRHGWILVQEQPSSVGNG